MPRRRRRVIQHNIEQPELYESYVLKVYDINTQQEDYKAIVTCCDVRLAQDDTTAALSGLGPCVIEADRYKTKHKVYDIDFPVAVTRVRQFKCTTHGSYFTYLTPTIWEKLSDSVVMEPELVVLTDSLVLTKRFWDQMAEDTYQAF